MPYTIGYWIAMRQVRAIEKLLDELEHRFAHKKAT